MDNNLALTVKSALPLLQGGITYSDIAKMFLTIGYVSQAGNMYQQGVRLSKRMAIRLDIGHGQYHTFLNGIQLYTWDGGTPKMVAHRGDYYDFRWTDDGVNREIINVVKDYIKNEIQVQGVLGISDSDIKNKAYELVEETQMTTELIGNKALESNTPLCLKG